MDTQTKMQALGATFYGSVTFNGPMFDIHDNHHVVIQNKEVCPREEVQTTSDRQMTDILKALTEATDAEGTRVFAQQNQWYAVFRVLSEQCDYPANMKDFCRVMTDMGMGEATPPCRYESIKKVPAEMTQLACKTTLWRSYLNRATTQAKKQIEVALKLMDLLAEKM